MSRIIILGAGATGAFLAGRLHEAGHDVLLIARGKRLEVFHRDGVALSEEGELRRVRVPVAAQCSADARPEHVIVATKTFQLREALALLSPYGDLQFNLLTVQNGTEAPVEAQTMLPNARVLGGRVHGFFEIRDDVAFHRGVPASIAMGPFASAPWPSEHLSGAELLREALRDARVDTTLVADSRPALWDKFLMASTVGAVAPAYGLAVGEVYGHRDARDALEQTMEEVAALAAAFGVALPDDCVSAKLEFVSRFPPYVTSSLQRDLEAKAPSEFVHLTGAIPRLARQVAVRVPATEQIIQKLRERGLLSD